MSNHVMDDLRRYKIFIVKFQMYTCDAGCGNFISYFNENQHWTFPKHNHNNGPNGHLFYVGGDLMMRRDMMLIIMLPDGDFVLRCT